MAQTSRGFVTIEYEYNKLADVERMTEYLKALYILHHKVPEDLLQVSVSRPLVITPEEVKMLLNGLDLLTPYMTVEELSVKAPLLEKLLSVDTSK